jgi:hypothetical protein
LYWKSVRGPSYDALLTDLPALCSGQLLARCCILLLHWQTCDTLFKDWSVMPCTQWCHVLGWSGIACVNKALHSAFFSKADACRMQPDYCIALGITCCQGRLTHCLHLFFCGFVMHQATLARMYVPTPAAQAAAQSVQQTALGIVVLLTLCGHVELCVLCRCARCMSVLHTQSQYGTEHAMGNL